METGPSVTDGATGALTSAPLPQAVVPAGAVEAAAPTPARPAASGAPAREASAPASRGVPTNPASGVASPPVASPPVVSPPAVSPLPRTASAVTGAPGNVTENRTPAPPAPPAPLGTARPSAATPISQPVNRPVSQPIKETAKETIKEAVQQEDKEAVKRTVEQADPAPLPTPLPASASAPPSGSAVLTAAPKVGIATRKSAEVFASAAVRVGGTPGIPVAATLTGTAAEVGTVGDTNPATNANPATDTNPATGTNPTTDTNPMTDTNPTTDTNTATGGRLPDFGRIAGAEVGVVAVPVAAVVRVARRKNVIGAETTGSIPVHLLFRDEPEGVAPAGVADDGGPDTVAMAGPVTSNGSPASRSKARPAIPAPSKVHSPAAPTAPAAAAQTKQAKQPKQTKRLKPSRQPKPGEQAQQLRQPQPPQQLQPPQGVRNSRQSDAVSGSRPAPTADPGLVERPGPVLPGWVGVVAAAVAVVGSAAVLWWTGAVPEAVARMLRLPVRPYNGIHLGQWALLALGVVATLFALGGLGRGRVGYAWVLTLFGEYRGTVRRTGLVWVSPLLLRRRVDVRLRHWRSEPLSAVDAKGTALDVVVLVVWRVRDTVRAALGIDGHEEYLREQVEAAMARVLSQLPADAFHEDAPTLRDAEAVGEALTRMLSAECAPVGVDVFSAQPTRIEYAPEVAAAMQRRRIAALDAKHRDSVLTSVVDAVDDVVHRLTSRGLVELDDYERKALVKDLTVAFYTGRTAPVEGA
ncbi:SPFH domain-containing protein [Streptomyces sp. NPDC093089]|uniref:SPFH domain-containing protein n=1 Tax=Streptomyces sp. NPDC093089 TaxID=3366024 RepID=UPI003819F9D1